MPRAPKPCGIQGCKTIVSNGTRCPDHANGWKTSPRTASSTITGTAQWQQFRKTILDRDHHTCQIRYPEICTGTATVVDKVTPAAKRADLAFNPGNARAACKPCNDHKARTTDQQ